MPDKEQLPVEPGKVYFSTITGRPVGTSDLGLAEGHLEHGATPLSQEQAYEAAKAAENLKYVDENWGAAGKLGMGLASGVTMGFGPGILAQAGLVDPGHIRAAQTSPLYTGGDIAGTLLPALFSGGESLAGRAAAITPAGIVDSLGNLTERTVGGILGESPGLLGKLASTPARMASRGAIEGAAINLGHTMGDALIDNKPLSAEALWASGKDGALAGGLIGGTLGTVGAIGSAAVEGLGKVASSGVGKSVREGVVLRRLGAGAEEAGDIVSGKTSSNEYFGNVQKVLDKASEAGVGAKIGSSDAKLYGAFRAGKEAFVAERKAAIEALDSSAGAETPSLKRVIADIKGSILSPKVGTAAEPEAFMAFKDINRKLSKLGKNPDSWEKWIESRDYLANKLSGETRTEVLNVIDREISNAMQHASDTVGNLSGIADKYASSTALAKFAEQLEENLGKKASSKLLNSQPAITPRDAALAGSFATVNPYAGAVGLLGKVVSKQLEGKLEPAIAQMAFNASIGQKAAVATNMVKTRISSGIANFFKSAPPKTASTVYAERSKGPTRKEFEDHYSRVEQLLSANHQDRVRRYAENLHDLGYQELAKSMMDTNNKAVQYLSWNMPARRSAGGMHSLRKTILPSSLDTNEFKFLRQSKAIGNPMSLMDNIENGTVSRDQVKALKYVYPELHTEIVLEAQKQIYEMKQKGDFLPMSKITGLSLALDAPLDSTQTPEYISAVQASLAPASGVQHQSAQAQPMPPPALSPPIQSLQTPTELIA